VTTELALTNIRDVDFTGQFSLVAPEGLVVRLQKDTVALASGGHTVVPLEVTVKKDTPPEKYQVGIVLKGADGKAELERVVSVEHLGRLRRLTVETTGDASVQAAYPDVAKGDSTILLVDGGASKMQDDHHSQALFRFPLDVPGRIVRARFRILNAGNPSSDAGRICLVDGPWEELEVTYRGRPGVGREVGRIGRVEASEVVEVDLDVDLTGMTELNLVMDPTGCDGLDYLARESGTPATLILDYEPTP
jgi:hypothetical protein